LVTLASLGFRMSSAVISLSLFFYNTVSLFSFDWFLFQRVFFALFSDWTLVFSVLRLGLFAWEQFREIWALFLVGGCSRSNPMQSGHRVVPRDRVVGSIKFKT
jgi:hypothetical protein